MYWRLSVTEFGLPWARFFGAVNAEMDRTIHTGNHGEIDVDDSCSSVIPPELSTRRIASRCSVSGQFLNHYWFS